MFRLPRDPKSQLLLTAIAVGLSAFLAVSIWIARGQNQVARTAELRTAVLSSDLGAVQQLLADGADANGLIKNGGGTTALHPACEIGNLPIIETLLDAGADPNHASAAGRTPLHTAAISGDLAAVKLLLAHGADAQVDPNGERYTPITAALQSRQTEIAMLLLRDHLDADAPVPLLNTYLAYAVLHDSVEPAKLLVERGADANAMPEMPQPSDPGSKVNQDISALKHPKLLTSLLYPLHRAVYSQNRGAVEYLLSAGADPNLGGSLDLTPLMIAAYHNDVEIGDVLLAGGAIPDLTGVEGMTPLHVSTGFARLDFARLLVENGGRTALQNDEGETPLMYAHAHTPLTTTGLNGKRHTVAQTILPALIALGLDPNATGADGNTPAHVFGRRQLQLLEDLLESGGDLSIRNDAGQTPLAYALTPQWHDDKVDWRLNHVRALLAHGSDPNTRLPDGRTPLHLAVEATAPNSVFTLLESGADLTLEDRDGETPVDLARKLEWFDVIEAIDSYLATQGTASN